MFDSEFGAELVELVPAGGASFAQAEQAIGEFLAIVGENCADAYRAGPFQIAQEAPGIRCRLGFVDADEHPAGCPVDGHEQVTA